MQQEEITGVAPARLLHITPALVCCVLGLLYSVGAGLYVAVSTPGMLTHLAMQALILYSFPYLLLAGTGFAIYFAKRMKLHALIFSAGSAALLITAATVTFRSLDGTGNLIAQLDEANIAVFNTELIVAILSCAALLIAAKLTRT